MKLLHLGRHVSLTSQNVPQLLFDRSKSVPVRSCALMPNMVVSGETKGLQAGSSAPKINGLTLYSMRFCPYSERVRLILNIKNVPYEIVNINLKSKPNWFLERNPLGKVPSIEEPGKKPLYESLILTEYLDAVYPGTRLIVPQDPYEKARQKVLIEIILQPFHYMAFLKEFDALLNGLDAVEELLTTKYFAGDSMGYVDLMVYPWFERLPGLSEARNKAFEFCPKRFPKLVKWTEVMQSEPTVRATTLPTSFFTGFFSSFDSPTSATFDANVGL